MNDYLDKKATQLGFSKLVGVSQQAISKHLDSGVLIKGQTFREWLIFYCERLRDEAAGRGGNDQVNLTRARTREAVASAHLKELDVKTKTGTLIPVDEIEPSLEALVVALRTELLILPDKLTMAVKTMYDVDIDPLLIEEPIHEALQHFADGTSASDDCAS